SSDMSFVHARSGSIAYAKADAPSVAPITLSARRRPGLGGGPTGSAMAPSSLGRALHDAAIARRQDRAGRLERRDVRVVAVDAVVAEPPAAGQIPVPAHAAVRAALVHRQLRAVTLPAE